MIIIPAYNEEKNIRRVVYDIKKEGIKADILVVNDGSKDGTKDMVEECGAYVLDLPTNLGIGGARQAGLIYALENKYNLCIQMDADGQHPANNIKRLIFGLGDNEIVIGSRFINKQYKGSAMRRLGIIILSWVLKIVTKERITDPTSGLRAFRHSCISFLALYYPTDYPEVEPLIHLHWAGFRIREVPAIMKARQSGKSSITPLYYMVKVILAILINCFRKKPKWPLPEKGTRSREAEYV